MDMYEMAQKENVRLQNKVLPPTLYSNGSAVPGTLQHSLCPVLCQTLCSWQQGTMSCMRVSHLQLETAGLFKSQLQAQEFVIEAWICKGFARAS